MKHRKGRYLFPGDRLVVTVEPVDNSMTVKVAPVDKILIPFRLPSRMKIVHGI